MESCVFACVADSRYWVGAVALVNSLRLVGHGEPVLVLDAGLTPAQRATLERGAEVVRPPAPPRAPFLGKAVAAMAVEADARVVVDADVVAVRSLAPLVDDVRRGQFVAFVDEQPARFHAEWARLVGVDRLHAHPYVNSGFLGIPADLAGSLLERARESLERVDLSAARMLGRGSLADPFHLADQDVWNAVLRAWVPPSRLRVLERRLAPFVPREAVAVEDQATLRCRTADGSVPYLLHHIGPKPWLAPAPPTAYSTLLPRLLTAADVAIRLRRDELPPRVRWPRIAGPAAIPQRAARTLRRARQLVVRGA